MTDVNLRTRDLEELRTIAAGIPRTGSGVRPHVVPDRTLGGDNDLAHAPREARGAVIEQLEPEPQSPSITDLGRLSAEAVMQQWETAATGVEALGNDVRTMIGKLRDEMVRCDENLKRLAETAAEIREQGKLAQALVEQTSLQSDDILATCVGLSKKLKG